MTAWIGLFSSNIDGKTIRELEVEADTEEEAIVLLDFYEYDETWQHYSFVNIRKKDGNAIDAGLAIFNKIYSKLFLHQPTKLPNSQKTGEV